MAEDRVREALEGLLETIKYWQENGNLVDVSVDLAANVIEARAALAAKPYKGAITIPCSACSAGDIAMEHHDHEWVKLAHRADSKGTSAPLDDSAFYNWYSGFVDKEKHVTPKTAAKAAWFAALATSGAQAGEWEARAAEKFLQRHYNVALAMGDTREPERVHVSGWLNLISMAKELSELAAGRSAAPQLPIESKGVCECCKKPVEVRVNEGWHTKGNKVWHEICSYREQVEKFAAQLAAAPGSLSERVEARLDEYEFIVQMVSGIRKDGWYQRRIEELKAMLAPAGAPGEREGA